MGACLSQSAAVDPLASKLREGRQQSLHDHLVSHRSAHEVDDSYDLLGVLHQGKHSQIIKIAGKRYSKNNTDDNTYILKMLDPSAVNNNNKNNKDDDDDDEKKNFCQKKHVHNSVDALKREAFILMECDHPNIIKLYEYNKDRKRQPVSLVLEYCSGGTLASRLPYTDEAQVSRIVRQVLEALAYLHRKKIVHRDIHMSNILFESPQADANIKLIDFGSATAVHVLPNGKFEYMNDKVGTLETMAPDVLKGKYSPKADIWSFGVVAYQIMTGHTPFQGDTEQQLEEQILRGFVPFQDWTFSSVAKDLVQKCLALNPGYRPSAVEALHHDFIGKSKPPILIPNRLVVSFQLYRQCSPLKRAAWNVLARKLPPSEIASLRQLFRELDVNRSGTLTKDEFLQGFIRCGFDENELLSLFDALDINGGNEIIFTEFLAASLETHIKNWDDAQLREAFDLLDDDLDGLICQRDLTKILGNSPKVRNMLAQHPDANVSFDDFKLLFHTTSTACHIDGTMETLMESGSEHSDSDDEEDGRVKKAEKQPYGEEKKAEND